MTACNVFLDTCCFIYVLEHNDEIGDVARALVNDYKQQGFNLYTSTITLMEYTSKNHSRTLPIINSFVVKSQINIIPITKEIAYSAGNLRADSSIHAMDSLQLAAAQFIGDMIFLTNDKRLAQYSTEELLVKVIE